MSTFETTSAPFAAAEGFVVRVANVAASLFKALRNRREVYRLGQMSDFELADIGLMRGDLHVAMRMPLGTDPTETLGSFAEARAARELRAARQIC